jgi:hypothetical protein
MGVNDRLGKIGKREGFRKKMHILRIHRTMQRCFGKP